MWELDHKESWAAKNWCFRTAVLKKTLEESLGLQQDLTSPSSRRSVLNIHWKDWCCIWNSNSSATWCKGLSHFKRPWCWERLKAGGEGDHRGYDGRMASPTQWTWVWVNSRSWLLTGKLDMLQSMGSQIVKPYWVTELNWTELNILNFLQNLGLGWKEEQILSFRMLGGWSDSSEKGKPNLNPRLKTHLFKLARDPPPKGKVYIMGQES